MLLSKTTQIARYFAASFAYTKSLKPKPTTRAKSSASAGRR